MKLFYFCFGEGSCLVVRAPDCDTRGRGFHRHSGLRVVFLSKTYLLSKALVIPRLKVGRCTQLIKVIQVCE